VVRYVAYILVTVIALVLAGSIAVVLGKGAVACLAGRPAVYVTAFDGVGSVGGHPPRIRAMFEGPRGPRPLDSIWAVVRFRGGWIRWAYINRQGLCHPHGPADLPPGPHRFRVGLPEVHRRLDVVAHGTAWIWPRGCRVLWVDASALVPPGTGPAVGGDAALPPASARAGLEALQALASPCRCVYLVADDARGYAAARRRLKMWVAPAGPAFWVIPGRAYGRLNGLKGVWPRVCGAVVASDDLADAAGRLEVPVERLSAAGEDAPASPADRAWRRTLNRLTSRTR